MSFQNYFRVPIIASVFCLLNAFIMRRIRSKRIVSLTTRGISDLRKEYSKIGLNEAEIPLEPFSLFKVWFNDACTANVLEPNAMCLSTCQVC